MTPEEELKAQAIEAQKKLRRALVEDHFPDSNEFFDSSPFARAIPDKLRFERNVAVSAWMERATGRAIEPGSPAWQAEKDAVLQGFFGINKTGVSDDEVHGLIRAHILASEDAQSSGIRAGMSGAPGIASLQEFDAKRGPSLVRSIWPKYSNDFQSNYRAASALRARYARKIDDFAGMLQEEGDATLPVTRNLQTISDNILDTVPEKHQAFVLSAIAATAARTPDGQKSLLKRMAAALGRGAESLGASTESNLVDMIYAGAAAESLEARDIEGARIAMEQSAEMRRRYLTADMVRKILEEGVPIPEDGPVEHALIGASRMAPLTASAFTGPPGLFAMAAQLRDDAATQLLMQNQGMSVADADAIATVATPANTAIEFISNRIPFGKVPFLGKWLNRGLTSWRSMLTRGMLLRIGAGTTAEVLEEMAQHENLLLTQELAAELTKDIAHVDWFERNKELKKLPGEVFGPALLLSIVGGGASSIVDMKDGRALASNRDLLIATGAAPELAEKIAGFAEAGNWQEVDSLLRRVVKPEAGDKATDEQRKAAAVRFNQQGREAAQADAEAAKEAGISIRKMADGWQVSSLDDGATTTVSTHDEAMGIVRGQLEARGIQRDETELDAIAALMETAPEGWNHEISTPAMTALDRYTAALSAGKADAAEAIFQRSEIQAERMGLVDDTMTAEQRQEAVINLMPRLRILGESVIELKENIASAVQRTFDGANAMDVIEENSETALKRLIAQGRATWARMAELIQQVEQATGDKYLHTFDASTGESEANQRAVTEAFSELTRVYAAATRKGSGKIGEATRKAKVREVQNARQERTRLRKAIADGKIPATIAQALADAVAMMRAVIRQVANLAKAKKEGKLQDIEGFIKESLGLSQQEADAAAVEREARNVWEETKQQARLAAEELRAAAAAAERVAASRATPEDASNITEMPDGALLVGPTTFSIRAHHGTPHKVDRFITDKIGTGEGAQAYGWGLYFAEDQTVGEMYRERLADVEREKISKLRARIDDARRAIEGARGRIEAGDYNVTKTPLARWIEIDQAGIAEREAEIARAEQEITDLKAFQGNLYTVELLPDESEFLDWDKPLSEQSEKVKDALAQYNITEENLQDEDFVAYYNIDDLENISEQFPGSVLYKMVGIRARDGTDIEPSSRHDSSVLLKLGIPGIKFLDGNSRTKGEGTRNYVIFDDKLVKILEENGRPVNGVDEELRAAAAAAQGGTSTQSMRVADRLNSLEDELSSRASKSTPEQTRSAWERARAAMVKIREDIDAIPEIRTLREINREARIREGLAYDEYLRETFHADTEAKQKAVPQFGRDAARAEAKAEVEAWRRAEVTKRLGKGAEKERLVSSMRLMDAILAGMPKEVRGKLGGYAFVAIAQKGSHQAMLEEIERRLPMIDEALETHFRKELTEQVQATFERYRPERESGKKTTGKLGADTQELVDAAENAMSLSALETAAEIARLQSLIDSGELTPEQQVQAERRRDLVELFGNWKTADTARMGVALESLEHTASEGWAKWRLKKIIQREGREQARNSLRADTGKDGTRQERSEQLAHDETFWGRLKNFRLGLSSFPEVVSFIFGSKSEMGNQLVDSERRASNQYEDDVQELGDAVEDLFKRLGGSLLRGEQMRYDMTRPTIDTRTEKLSQLQAIQALLMWRQEDGRRHMEGPRDENGLPIPGKWSYDQAWIDNVERQLTPEARQVMDFISARYAAEYGPLNKLYRERYGISLPHHSLYSPLTVKPQQAKMGEIIDPVSGMSITGSALTPSGLRTRSRGAIAEPEFRDALQTLIAHNKQMAHWRSYFDVASEAQAILGNRDVMNAAEAVGGEQAVTALRKWIDIFAMGGVRDAAAGLEVHRGMQRVVGRAAQMAIIGRVSSIMVQATQLGAALAEMPTGAYLKRFGMLMTGQLGWGDAIRSDFIQRRIRVLPPIVRQAMDHLASVRRPNIIKQQVRYMGALLNGADAFWTAATYAIILDHRRGLAKNLGLTGEEAEAWARNETERSVERVAQPYRPANKSLFEVTNTAPLARAMFAFASEARQKVSLLAWAAANAKHDKGRAARVAFLVFVVGGLGAQILRNLWREAKDDDDEEMWSAKRLAIATASGPLTGVPGYSAMMETGGGLFRSVTQADAAAEHLLDPDRDLDKKLRDAETLMTVAGLGSGTFASLTSMMHLIIDSKKVITNLTDGED